MEGGVDMKLTPDEIARMARGECGGCGHQTARCIEGIRGGVIACCFDCDHFGLAQIAKQYGELVEALDAIASPLRIDGENHMAAVKLARRLLGGEG